MYTHIHMYTYISAITRTSVTSLDFAKNASGSVQETNDTGTNLAWFY